MGFRCFTVYEQGNAMTKAFLEGGFFRGVSFTALASPGFVFQVLRLDGVADVYSLLFCLPFSYAHTRTHQRSNVEFEREPDC